jgi:hypothetical protein
MNHLPALSPVAKIIPGMSASSVINSFPHEVYALSRLYQWSGVATWMFENGVVSQRTQGPLQAGSLRVGFCRAKRRIEIDEERVKKLMATYISCLPSQLSEPPLPKVAQSANAFTNGGLDEKRIPDTRRKPYSDLGRTAIAQIIDSEAIPRDQDGKFDQGQVWRPLVEEPNSDKRGSRPPAAREMKTHPIQGGLKIPA